MHGCFYGWERWWQINHNVTIMKMFWKCLHVEWTRRSSAVPTPRSDPTTRHLLKILMSLPHAVCHDSLLWRFRLLLLTSVEDFEPCLQKGKQNFLPLFSERSVRPDVIESNHGRGWVQGRDGSMSIDWDIEALLMFVFMKASIIGSIRPLLIVHTD